MAHVFHCTILRCLKHDHFEAHKAEAHVIVDGYSFCLFLFGVLQTACTVIEISAHFIEQGEATLPRYDTLNSSFDPLLKQYRMISP